MMPSSWKSNEHGAHTKKRKKSVMKKCHKSFDSSGWMPGRWGQNFFGFEIQILWNNRIILSLVDINIRHQLPSFTIHKMPKNKEHKRKKFLKVLFFSCLRTLIDNLWGYVLLQRNPSIENTHTPFTCTIPTRKQIKFYFNMNYNERNDSRSIIECFSRSGLNGAWRQRGKSFITLWRRCLFIQSS